jgi:hypothetical protein
VGDCGTESAGKSIKKLDIVRISLPKTEFYGVVVCPLFERANPGPNGIIDFI